MAITLVQSRSVAGVSLAYNSNVTIGDLLIVVAGDATVISTATFAIADTQGNSYTALALVDASGISGGRGQLFFAVAKATGANTVTLTTAAPTPQLLIHEFSSVNTLDKSQSGTGSGTALDSGAVTTSVANELLFGFAVNVITVGISLTSGPGWTQAEILGLSAITEYQVVSATGTFDATATVALGKAGTCKWLAEIATFNAAAAAVSGDYWLGGRQHETKIILPGYAN